MSAGVLTGGFGGGLGLGGGYGAGLALGGGYGAGLALGGGYGVGRAVPIGPVHAAVHSRRTYDVIPVPTTYDAPIPQVIEVGPNVQPVHFIFRSQSSPITVQQIHTPGVGGYEATRSEDAPHQLVHEVYKPIIQELRETIQPFRKIIQKVEPVQEEVHTVVAQGQPQLHAAPLPYAAPAIRAAPLLTGRAY